MEETERTSLESHCLVDRAMKPGTSRTSLKCDQVHAQEEIWYSYSKHEEIHVSQTERRRAHT